jgi:hypothetical protein
VEFAQGAVDIAVDQKKVRRFPRHIGSGRLGLQRAFQCRSLASEIAGYLIRARQIEPIVGIVGVEGDGGPKAANGGLRIAGNQRKVAPEPMAIVGISRRETHRALQRGQLGTRGENASGKLRARKKKIDDGESNQTHRQLPTPPV